MTYSKTASSASVSKKSSPSTSPFNPSSMIRKNGASASKPGRTVSARRGTAHAWTLRCAKSAKVSVAGDGDRRGDRDACPNRDGDGCLLRDLREAGALHLRQVRRQGDDAVDGGLPFLGHLVVEEHLDGRHG